MRFKQVYSRIYLICKLIFRYLLLNNIIFRVRIARLNKELSAKQIKEYREKALRKTLIAAKTNLLNYNDINIPSSEEDAESFLVSNIPIITKKDLQNKKKLFYPNYNKNFPWSIIGRTSGTTGSPLDVVRSYNSILWENVFVHKHWSQVKEVGEKSVRVTLRGDDIGAVLSGDNTFWFFNMLENQLLMSSKDLSSENIPIFINKLRGCSASILQAYPSTAFILAKYLDSLGERLNIPYVFTGSEMLHPYQRELIEKTIGKVYDFYGMAERVAFVTECRAGNLHVNEDYSYVEIVDDQGNHTDDEGFIVGTTYHNLKMPLLRYQMSDRSRWKKGKCTCGSNHRMIEPVSGKFEDMLSDASGKVISPSLITFAFKGVSNIDMSQVAQISSKEWEVRVVALPGFSNRDRDHIKRNLGEIISPDTKVLIRCVDNIARTKAGKYRWVVNEQML